MKLKTSVTLSEEVVRALDRAARKGESRSQAVDRLLRERLEEQGRLDADRRELELINRHAVELNVEAQDVLTYQGDV